MGENKKRLRDPRLKVWAGGRSGRVISEKKRKNVKRDPSKRREKKRKCQDFDFLALEKGGGGLIPGTQRQNHPNEISGDS